MHAARAGHLTAVPGLREETSLVQPAPTTPSPPRAREALTASSLTRLPISSALKKVGERRLYYRCPGRLASYGHRCSKPWQRAELADALVWDHLCATVLDPVWIEEFMRRQNENAGARQSEVDAQREVLLVQRLDVQKRLDWLTDMREGGELTREEYLVRRAQREAELKKLDEELSRLEASIGARYTEQEIADRVALMTKIKRGTVKANRAERRAIVEWLDLQVKYTVREGQLGLELRRMLTLKDPDFVGLDCQVTLSTSSSL